MGKVRTYLELVSFSHTVFALPFALLSMITAARGLPEYRVLLWILIAMVSARTSAMAFNRVADAKIDGKNPRTKDRHLPSGKVGILEVMFIVIISSALFIFSAYKLNKLCLVLSPVALLIILSYSYSKRFTYLNHFWLGLSLSIAPVGAWIAVRGEMALPPIVLGISVLFWVAGFDIIYSLQDYKFDKKSGLHSLVVKLGIKKALIASRILHLMTLVTLYIFSIISGLGIIFKIALVITAFLLLYEHSLVKPEDLTKINLAFFTLNGTISVILLLAGSIDISLGLR